MLNLRLRLERITLPDFHLRFVKDLLRYVKDLRRFVKDLHRFVKDHHRFAKGLLRSGNDRLPFVKGTGNSLVELIILLILILYLKL